LDRQRIDKWLWHARVVRTRTAAAGLVEGGLVRLNGTRVEAASRAVRVGDVVTVALDRIRVLRIAGFSERRGSALEAAPLFEDMSPPAPTTPAAEGEQETGATRRPTKQERRELLRLKWPGNG
jgi:ribosome-associated heat shock protein Hsp15